MKTMLIVLFGVLAFQGSVWADAKVVGSICLMSQ